MFLEKKKEKEKEGVQQNMKCIWTNKSEFLSRNLKK